MWAASSARIAGPQLSDPMPIHLAITRRAKPGFEAEFQEALREFFRDSFGHVGVLGATMIVPPPGSTSGEFGILRSFANENERDAFYASPAFKAWEERCQPLTEGSGSRRELHGLEAWFHNPSLPHPPRWKMAAATLLGVYPTSLLLGIFVAPRLEGTPHAMKSLVIGVLMVTCLTWLVMPAVTKLLHRWLNPDA
jgi:antibiotic biosynthesis monooxygenase (ABM) superfamily enzyme